MSSEVIGDAIRGSESLKGNEEALKCNQTPSDARSDAIRGAPGSASSSCSPIDGASAAEQLRMKARW